MGQTEQTRLKDRYDAVKAIAAERLDAAMTARFMATLDVIYDDAAPEDVLAHAPEALYGATMALSRFLQQRVPGQPKLRLYTPRRDEHGWESRHSVVELVHDDMPFLVDSLTAALTEAGRGIHSVIHPIIAVQRDDTGRFQSFAARDESGAITESVMQIQIDQIGDESARAALESALLRVVGDVTVCVRDWKPILGKLSEATEALRRNAPPALQPNVGEATALLDWLGDNNFTFLGYRDFAVDAQGRTAERTGETGLGLLAEDEATVFRAMGGDFADWSPEGDYFENDEPVLIIKANRRSTVHRAAHLDFIGVKRFDTGGRLIGEATFVGLFTSAAYNRSPQNIPLLRSRVSRVIERAGFAPSSHNGKALVNVLERFPRDELFQSTDEQLFENAMGALHLATRPRPRVLLRPDRFGRFVFCMIYIPRERYSTDLRQRIGDILSDALDGRVASWSPAFTDALTRLDMVIAMTGDGIPAFEPEALERDILEAVRSWADTLRDALVERHGEPEGAELHARYAEGFDPAYRYDNDAGVATGDIEKFESLSAQAPLAIKFYRRLEDAENAVRVKLYLHGAPMALSDCVPVLENMGLRILEEHPYSIERGDETLWMNDFLAVSNGAVDLSTRREKLEDGFGAALRGEVDDDRLNRLVLLSGLSVRQVSVLRAYARYLRQARLPYSIEYMEEALCENPEISGQLASLFAALFDPAANGDRDSAAQRITDQIETSLDAVASLDFDRIIRRFRNAILSTLRTNAYQPGADGAPKDYMSFKLDSGALDELPLPRPWREIFVYSTWIEGVHLRGGPVARGGLRWSDRKEDYRTEVLGLVKAQQVKNAVIVPVGSKGGFLPKKLPVGGSRDAVQAEAIRAYKTFLSGLLDVTDNLDGAEIVPPSGVVRRDADDPYLVVAADKGTATFSDIANGVARDYGFWLDDAFASGGSNGYDHKGMGITARGGWEAVKRHFRELGHDTQTQPFTVCGVGDMSGDVFGNGMLLSEQIRLVAAFDHRDIFFDPSPDPETQFAERKRLFEMGRSSWKDFDTTLISKGGGVFPRSAKSIDLTPEIRALIGLDQPKATPTEIMSAILRMNADLMWFGGIGTYIKADAESHAEVGDRGTDAIRVSAHEVRARVIGEGANLGITQRGRIDLSARGVKLNTDAVDNSAGVDCSDHEVNIKIALSSVVGAGDMTEKQRNELLAEMTDEVGELVLETNYNQTLCISVAESRASHLLGEHARLMKALEGEGRLDRAVELLPSEEQIAERASAGRGLTRPEIAVLVAYAKIHIFDALVKSEVPDDPFMARFAIDYMPVPIRERFADAVRGHRLRREIIATVAANMLVNEGGPALYNVLREETGCGPATVCKAFVIAREAFGLRALADQINALDNVATAAAQNAMHQSLARAAGAQTGRALRLPSASIGEKIDAIKPGIEAIAASFQSSVSGFASDAIAETAAEWAAAGVPDALAREVAALEFMGGALDIVGAAGDLDRDVEMVSETYFAAGAKFGLDWLRYKARGMEPGDYWDKVALGRIVADLRSQQSAIASAALAADGLSGAAAIDAWAGGHAKSAADRAIALVEELRAGSALSIAKLAVVSSELKRLSVV